MLAILVATALGHSESQRHYHSGKLQRYEIGPPSTQLSAKEEGRLRSGKAVMQQVEAEDGTLE